MKQIPRLLAVVLLLLTGAAYAQVDIPTPFNGNWKMGGSVVTVVQSGTNVSATFKKVAPTAKLYKEGDTAFTGSLKGTAFTGTFELRQRAESGDVAKKKTPIELTLLPGGSKLKGRFEDRQFDKADGEWTDKTRWVNLLLTRDEQATPRFVIKKENLGIDLKHDTGTFVEAKSVREGVPFWVELQFDDAPDGMTRSVTIASPGGEGEVTVTRAGEDGKLYRSGKPLMFEAQMEVPPAEPNKAPPAPRKVITAERTPIDWFHGSWRVTYFDQNLGQINGSADVQPNNNGGVDVAMMLRHPDREGYQYHLRSTKSELKGDTLTVTLDDHSPSSARMITGHDHAENVRDAEGLFVSVGSTNGATATFGDNEAKLAFSDEPPADAKREITLTFDLKAQTEKLVVDWSIAMDPKLGFIGRRHGRIKLDEPSMTGLENWSRLGIQIDTVTSLEDIDNSKWRSSAGMLIDGQTIKPVWLRLEGKGLTFEPREDLQVIFDDKTIEYTGNHRKDEAVEGAWNIQVDLNRDVTPGEKTFTLNEAPGVWTFDPKGLDPTVTFVRQVMEDTFRDAQELYGGEMFRLQARYKTKPYFDQRDIELLIDKRPAATLTLTRSKDDPNVYHSQAMLLPGNPAAYEAVFGDAKGAAVDVPPDAMNVAAKEGDTLVGRFKPLPDRQPKREEIAVARVLGLPSNEWIKALETAEDCYRNSNNDIKTTNPKGYAFSNVILTSLGTRTVRLNMRDHAALLLVRDFATKALRAKVREMNAPDPVSLIKDREKHDAALKRSNAGKARFAEALINAAGKGANHPLFVMEVSSPNGNDKLKLRDALRTSYLKANVGSRKQDQVDYAVRVVSEAEGVMLGYSSLSLDRLQGTGDCDVDRLLRTCGMGFGRCAELVKDKLLTPANDGSGRLVPDRAGYASIDKIAGLYQAVKSQEEYARADTDLVVFLATSPFLFLSVSANFGYLAGTSYASTLASVGAGGLIAADAVEVPLLFSDASQYVKLRDEEIGFRKGTVAIEGTEALEQTEAEANELYWRTLLAGGAMVGGTAIGEVGGVVAKRLAKGNIDALEDAVVAASRNGLNSLSGDQLNKLADAGLLKVLRENPGAGTADAVLAALAEQKQLLRTGGKEAAETGADVANAADSAPAPGGAKSAVDTTADAGAEVPAGGRGATAGDDVMTTPNAGSAADAGDDVMTTPNTGSAASAGDDAVTTPNTGSAASAGDDVVAAPNTGSAADAADDAMPTPNAGPRADAGGNPANTPNGGRRAGAGADPVTTPNTNRGTNTGRRPASTPNANRGANAAADAPVMPGARRATPDAEVVPNAPRNAEAPAGAPPRRADAPSVRTGADPDGLTKAVPPPAPGTRAPRAPDAPAPVRSADPNAPPVMPPARNADAGAPPARGASDPDGLTTFVPPPNAARNAPAPPRNAMPDAPAPVRAADATPPRTIDINGEQVQLGKKLGEGQYSEVYELTGNRKGQVIKIAKVTENTGPQRAAEKVLEAKQISDLLEENGIPQVRVVDIHADPNGQSYTITEIIPDDAKLVDHLELGGNRADLVASGKWSPEHERAVFELYDKMAANNLVWLDGHLDNIYFKPGADGKLTAAILDHDMIAPLNALDANLKKRMSDAFFDGVGSLQGLKAIERLDYMPKDAYEAMALMLEYKRMIDFADGKFVPLRLDPAGLKNFDGFSPYIKPDDVVSDGLLARSATNLNETAKLDMPDFTDLTGTAKLDMPEFDDLKSSVRTGGAADELTETAKLDMPDFGDLNTSVRAGSAGDELTETAKLDMPDFGDLNKSTRGGSAADELTETAKLDMPDFTDLTGTAKLDMPEFDDLKSSVRTGGAADELTETAKLDMPDFGDLNKSTRGGSAADELTETAKLDMPDFTDLTGTAKLDMPEFEDLKSSVRAGAGDDLKAKPYKPLPDAPASNSFVDPMNPPEKIVVQGEQLEIGEYIGKGEYSVVYKLKGAREGQVIKIAKVSDATSPQRAAEKVLEAKQISDLLAENDIPQVRVLDVSADPNGQSYTISELLPPKAFEVDNDAMFYGRAKQIAEGNWSANHEHAVLELYDRMASKDLLWLDGHLNNIYFFPDKNGKLTAGILDHDMIAPLTDLPPSLEDRLADVIAGAGLKNVHSLNRLPIGKRLQYAPKTGHEAMALMLEHKGLIGFENGKFIPRSLDPKSLEIFEKFKPYIDPDNVVSDGLLNVKPPAGGSALPLRFQRKPLRIAA